jgi:hypothetical protein
MMRCSQALRVVTAALVLAFALAPSGGPHSSRASGQAPAGSGTRTQVWIHPNFGSEDFLRMFTQPDAWSHVRDRLDVFSINHNCLRDPNSPAIKKWKTKNTWPEIQRVDAIRKLTTWGIAIDVSAAPIQPYPAGGLPSALENARRQAKLVLEAIDNVVAEGGKVQSVSMDEPLLHGGRESNYSMRDLISGIKLYVDTIHAKYPDIQVGEYVPYPAFSAAQIEQWIDGLSSAGVAPAFEHLDINYGLLMLPRQGLARARFPTDVQALAAYFKQRQIPFGVIIDAQGLMASSQQFFTQARQNAQIIRSILRGFQPHLVFQSWVEGPVGRKIYPVNLPETGNYSMTYLIRAVLNF